MHLYLPTFGFRNVMYGRRQALSEENTVRCAQHFLTQAACQPTVQPTVDAVLCDFRVLRQSPQCL